MKNTRLAYIKNFFSRRNSIIRATTAFFISLLLIIWPELLSSTLIIIFGSLMIAYAVFDIAKTIYDCSKTAKATAAAAKATEATEAAAKATEATEAAAKATAAAEAAAKATEAAEAAADEVAETTGKSHAPRFLDILKRIKLNTYLFLIIGILLIALKHFVLTAAMIILATALILSAMIQLWATVSWMNLSTGTRQPGTSAKTGNSAKTGSETTESKASQTAKWIFLAFPIISIILAIVILSNPFGNLKALLIFTGSSLMFYGVTEIARTIYFKATHRDTGETPKLLE